MVLSGSGNKAEETSNNPHMRFINAAAVASLAVDLVVPLKYFGLSQSPPPVIRAAAQVTPSSESSLRLFLLLRKIS